MKLGKILIILIVTSSLLLAGCGSIKVEAASEKESLKITKNFIDNILRYNESHEIDLSKISDLLVLWDYLVENDLSEGLSEDYLNAYSFNEKVTGNSTVSETLEGNVRPLINYIQGYNIDDLTFTYYNPEDQLSFVSVNFKPESQEKGIFSEDRAGEVLAVVFVAEVDGKKGIINIEVSKPSLAQNKFIWYSKDSVEGYKNEIREQKESAAEAEKEEQAHSECNIDTVYEDPKGIVFPHHACSIFTGNIDTGLDVVKYDDGDPETGFSMHISIVPYIESEFVYDDYYYYGSDDIKYYITDKEGVSEYQLLIDDKSILKIDYISGSRNDYEYEAEYIFGNINFNDGIQY